MKVQPLQFFTFNLLSQLVDLGPIPIFDSQDSKRESWFKKYFGISTSDFLLVKNSTVFIRLQRNLKENSKYSVKKSVVLLFHKVKDNNNAPPILTFNRVY